jgi:hypothetical protein
MRVPAGPTDWSWRLRTPWEVTPSTPDHASAIGPRAASLVEANRIEGVQAIGHQAEHSTDAVCRVAYAF